MPKDPVCGMNVNEKNSLKAEFNGKTYYFCSPTCHWAFEKDPKRFAK